VTKTGTKKLRLLVAGGGTGGHLYPALAIVEEVVAQNVLEEVLFVGTKNGIEAQKVPAFGYPIKFVWISGFQRSLKFRNLVFPLKVLWSLWQSGRIIRSFKPTVVLGTGGYVSGPVLYVATWRGLPTLIQEQNSYPGITTRLLAARVDQVHLSFAESKQYFKRQDNLRVTGNPVFKKLTEYDRSEAYQIFELAPDKFTILITGGSQGAQAINACVLELLDDLMQSDRFQLIWSTGKSDYEMIQTRCAVYGKRIWRRDFIDNMAAAYTIADLAITRAGALTLTELAIAAVPAILVPYPYAAGQHQLYNALSLMKSGAAIVIEQKHLQREKLLQTILELFQNPGQLKKMQERIQATAQRNASKQIVEALIKIST